MACHNLILTYTGWQWLDQLKCYFVNIIVVWEETNMFLTFENLQNWDIGASSWGAVPPLELSFWTWVGGTGLCDWPVARYIACTHRIRSCSSSLAKITVSPSFTALKNVRPPSRPEGWTVEEVLNLWLNRITNMAIKSKTIDRNPSEMSIFD